MLESTPKSAACWYSALLCWATVPRAQDSRRRAGVRGAGQGTALLPPACRARGSRGSLPAPGWVMVMCTHPAAQAVAEEGKDCIYCPVCTSLDQQMCEKKRP